MPLKVKLKFNPNHSPVDWYVGSIVLKFEELQRSRNLPKRQRKLVWENTILVQAQSLEQAYDKLIAHGKLHATPYTNSDGMRVRFKFEGIGDLLPIYQELEDGSEIMWADHGNISESRVRKLVRTKRQLLAARTIA